MDFQRRESESELDYIIRLVEGKNDGIYDIDYIELFKLAFDMELSSCEARKRYYGIRQLIPYIENNIDESDKTKKRELALIELKKERYKLQTLRHDLNKTIRENSRAELKVEEFIQEMKDMNKLELPEFKPLNIQKSNKEYLLSFADIHFGKEFESITNEYSIEKAYDRFNKLLSEVVEIIEDRGIAKLHILSIGDLVEGMCLRVSQLNKLKIGITQQTIQFMRFLVQWINELSKYTEIIYYSTTFANHGQIRPFGTKANQFEDEDVEKIIFAYIQDMLESNNRVTLVSSEEKYTMFKIFDYNIIANHGHKIKNVDRFLNDISMKYKIFFDYALLAHQHHGNIKTVGEGKSGNNNCEIIKIPSIMGTDEYADDLLVGAKAGAVLIEFTERQGKRVTHDIILN